MKILQLCLRVPFPLLDGGNIAMYQVARSLLKSGHTVHLLALNTQKHNVSTGEQESFFKKYFAGYEDRCRMESVPIDTTVKPWPALLHLVHGRSYNISRFYNSAYDRLLGQTLARESYDIVQMESLFMTPYLDTVRRHGGSARVVMRAHNVEHVIWQRLAAAGSSPIKKIYLNQLVKSLQRYETSVLPRLDAILPITPDDEAIFRACGYKGPMEIIPVSVDEVAPPVAASAFDTISLFHLGSMEWMPNVEGVAWFLDRCWPAIHAAWPGLQLYLAGKGFPEDLAARNLPGVTCEGTIADAAAYMRNKPVMIVPLLSGSGMRVKIIQGMAAGKIILSTSVGAEGIDCTDKEDILIADTPEEFLNAVHFCMQQRGSLQSISLSAQRLVEEKYSAASTGKKLDTFYKKIGAGN